MKVTVWTRFSIAVVGIATAVLTAAPALADDFTGLTYAKAQSLASQQGGTPVVATVSGDSVALDDCIVVSSRRSMFLDAGDNGTGRTNEILLNLNCNASLAAPGKPGASAASPQGRAAKKDNDNAEYIAGNTDVCYKDDATLQWCQMICNKTGKCEV